MTGGHAAARRTPTDRAVARRSRRALDLVEPNSAVVDWVAMAGRLGARCG